MHDTLLINIKDIAYILLAIVTITIAILGFNKWKKELRGKAYFEFSYRFLTAAYHLRDTIRSERQQLFDLPILLQNSADLSEERQWAIVEHHQKVYNQSKQNVLEKAIAYESLLPEGEALFKNFRKVAQMMIAQVHLYTLAIEEHLEYQYDRVGQSESSFSKEEYDTGIYPIIRFTKDDEFGQTVESIIEELNELLIKHIRPNKSQR